VNVGGIIGATDDVVESGVGLPLLLSVVSLFVLAASLSCRNLEKYRSEANSVMCGGSMVIFRSEARKAKYFKVGKVK
jgi:hypothetical protein